MNVWKKILLFQIFNSENVCEEGPGIFGRVVFPSAALGYEMCGDNGGRNASRSLQLRTQLQDAEVRHSYKHQDSYLRLGPPVSDRLLPFGTQTKVLRFLLIVTTKIKLICRGEGGIFTKMSLQRIFNIHAPYLPSHYHIMFHQRLPPQM